MNPSPDQPSASTTWADTVRREHEQADRFRTDDPSADHWKKLAHRFTPASREKAFEDETVQAVLKYAKPDDSILDVGAGSGRLAVPLADRCAKVTAVEPSEAMRERLALQAEEWGLENLEIVGDKWEDAEVEQADVVICAHVVYTVEPIREFIFKLLASSRREVLIVVFEEPAMANYFPLWELIYGEKRISLPSLHELESVLNEMNISFTSEPLPEWQSRPFADEESAFDESLARLFISPSNTSESVSGRLKKALAENLAESDDGLRFRWAKPHRPWLVRCSV